MYWPHEEETPIIPSSGHSIQTPCIKQYYPFRHPVSNTILSIQTPCIKHNIIHSDTLYQTQYYPFRHPVSNTILSIQTPVSNTTLSIQIPCCCIRPSPSRECIMYIAPNKGMWIRLR